MAYLSPDVYIQEVSGGTKPIEAVGTSTAGFVGEAPNGKAAKYEAVGISNWTQFVTTFVGAENASEAASTALVWGVWGFFQNGGSRCYVVNIGKDKSITKGLAALESEDDVAIVAAPGFNDPASYQALLTHAETTMQDRVAILDGPPRVKSPSQLTNVATVSTGSAGDGKDDKAMGPPKSERGYCAFYYPWIIIADPLHPEQKVEVPPSGHLAGIYARTDANRGVHKAPANEGIRGAIGVTHRLTRGEQDELNPNGINCIRLFSGEGILVWGARTLSKDPEWKYLNVRRLFNMIEESIARSTRWVVFEPNDDSLWKAIKRDVSAFLTLLWRDGALMGSTPDQAFFVKCDQETNTPEVIDAGRVVTVIGIAPVKPAEFIIFQCGQHAGGTDTES